MVACRSNPASCRMRRVTGATEGVSEWGNRHAQVVVTANLSTAARRSVAVGGVSERNRPRRGARASGGPRSRTRTARARPCGPRGGRSSQWSRSPASETRASRNGKARVSRMGRSVRPRSDGSASRRTVHHTSRASGRRSPMRWRRWHAGSVGTPLTSGTHMICESARRTLPEKTPRLMVKSSDAAVALRLFWKCTMP